MRALTPRGCPLEGAWRIVRRIDDRRARHEARFHGTARIAPDPALGPGALAWHEEGDLASPAHRGRATRDMRIVPAGDAWEVLFADGRPFHPLDLRSGRCEVVHLCGADRYEGVIELPGPERASIAWRITGPAKDLVIAGDYRREGATQR